MRLDHLLSREPILWGTIMVSVRWVGALVCFLVPACVHCLRVGGGCGCVFGLGIKVFWQADTLSGSRSTPCERPPLLVVVARAAS